MILKNKKKKIVFLDIFLLRTRLQSMTWNKELYRGHTLKQRMLWSMDRAFHLQVKVKIFLGALNVLC